MNIPTTKAVGTVLAVPLLLLEALILLVASAGAQGSGPPTTLLQVQNQGEDIGQIVLEGAGANVVLTGVSISPQGPCAGHSDVFGGDGLFMCMQGTGAVFDCGPALGGLPPGDKSALDRINFFPDSGQLFFDYFCEKNGQEVSDFGQATTAPAGCQPSPTTLCLNDGRFGVTMDWTNGTFQGTRSANVHPDSFGLDDSGFFFFDDRNNLELLVKVIDACAFNSRFWVFGAAGTDVEFTVRVTDTEGQETRVYRNTLGNPSEAINDTDAFDTCPSPG